MTTETKAGKREGQETAPPTAPVPTYEKPVIRKYSQIKQVKPYGPVAD